MTRTLGERWRELLHRRFSIRMRVMLLAAGLFLLLGFVLILATFAVGRAGVSVAVNAHPGPQFPTRITINPATGLILRQHAADNSRLGAVLLILFAMTVLISLPLGWLVSRRMLRPLRQITARARMISAGNLHERVALAGAADEFTELSETLDELLARLESSFDAQRRFVANASHELRTPLTLERTLLQVALADPEANVDTLRATCQELLAAGYEQERLLEALLTLASSERGLEHREPLDLAVLAKPILESPRPEIETYHLRLSSELGPAPAEGDPALVQRLVSNLVDNAVRHNVPGGHLEIRTATVDGQATIVVANGGQLIGEDEIALMFEPFRRLGPARTGTDQGHHGLGLSIVRAIANAHGASIAARPRTEGGLEVTVTFPALVADPGG
jgi:signal transduction histidine kinase